MNRIEASYLKPVSRILVLISEIEEVQYLVHETGLLIFAFHDRHGTDIGLPCARWRAVDVLLFL